MPTDQAPLRRLLDFCSVLRLEGVNVGLDNTMAFVSAAALFESGRLEDIYWSGRTTLAHRRSQIPIYDACFTRFFLGGNTDDETTRLPARFAGPESDAVVTFLRVSHARTRATTSRQASAYRHRLPLWISQRTLPSAPRKSMLQSGESSHPSESPRQSAALVAIEARQRAVRLICARWQGTPCEITESLSTSPGGCARNERDVLFSSWMCPAQWPTTHEACCNSRIRFDKVAGMSKCSASARA